VSLVVLLVVTVLVVVMAVLVTLIAKSAGNTQRKITCRTLVETDILLRCNCNQNDFFGLHVLLCGINQRLYLCFFCCI